MTSQQSPPQCFAQRLDAVPIGYHGTVDTDHLHCEVQIYALAEERDWQSATTDKQDRHVVTAP